EKEIAGRTETEAAGPWPLGQQVTDRGGPGTLWSSMHRVQENPAFHGGGIRRRSWLRRLSHKAPSRSAGVQDHWPFTTFSIASAVRRRVIRAGGPPGCAASARSAATRLTRVSWI